MFGFFIIIFPVYNLDEAFACKATADIETNVDILENLAKVIGFEKGAFQTWVGDGAMTGVEDGGIVGVEEGGIRNWIEEGGVIGIEEGGIDLFDNMREAIGVQNGGVVGVAADGVKVNADITTGGITIGVIAVIFGIFFLIVIYLLRNNRNQKDMEKSSDLQVRIILGLFLIIHSQ